MKKIKCQCPFEGKFLVGMEGWYDKELELPFVEHKPNECKCTNKLKQYLRDGKKIWLCSCCVMFNDKLIEQEKKL